MDFTLPALTQESFSRWYNKQVLRTDDIDERIVYPGIKLNCSTKSRDLRSNISPNNDKCYTRSREKHILS